MTETKHTHSHVHRVWDIRESLFRKSITHSHEHAHTSLREARFGDGAHHRLHRHPDGVK